MVTKTFKKMILFPLVFFFIFFTFLVSSSPYFDFSDIRLNSTDGTNTTTKDLYFSFTPITNNTATPLYANISFIPNFDNSSTNINYLGYNLTFGNHMGNVTNYVTNVAGTKLGTSIGNAEGYLGYGTYFEGLNQYLSYTDYNSRALFTNNSYTISLWARWKPLSNPGTGATGSARIITDGSNLFNFGNSVGNLGFTDLRNSTASISLNYVVDIGTWNQWNHYVIVYNGSHAYLYMNKTLVATDSLVPLDIPKLLETSFNIGGRTTYNNWTGDIDEVMVWERALTQNEVRMLYNFTKGLRFLNNAVTNGTSYQQKLDNANTTTNENWRGEVYISNKEGTSNSTSNGVFILEAPSYPIISFTAPTLNNGTIQRTTSIWANVTSNGGAVPVNYTFKLYNSTGLWNITTITKTFINWTGLNNGIYLFNVTGTSIDNLKNNTGTSQVIIDTAIPIISGGVVPVNIFEGIVAEIWAVVQDAYGVISSVWADIYDYLGNFVTTVILQKQNETYYNNTFNPMGYGLNDTNLTVIFHANDTALNIAENITYNFTYEKNDAPFQILTIENKTSLIHTNITYSFGSYFHDNDTSQLNYTLSYGNRVLFSMVNETGEAIFYANYPTSEIFNVSVNDGRNNATSNNFNITFTKINSLCNISITGSSPFIYPDTFYAYSNCDSDFTIYRNGTAINNNSLQELGVSSYNFTVIRTDQTNYTNIFSSLDVIINKAVGSIKTYINGYNGNRSAYAGANINISSSLVNGYGNIKLLANETLINQGLYNSISNITSYNYNFTANITSIYEPTQNYTGSSETYWIKVINAPVTRCNETTLVELALGSQKGNIPYVQLCFIWS